MKVLVDTSVWSLSLRRSRVAADPAVEALRHLIDEGSCRSNCTDAPEHSRVRPLKRAR
jgi:hypothetical protein